MKIINFNLLIGILKSKFQDVSLLNEITIRERNNQPMGSTAWLSGFIDADGCFSIKPLGFSIVQAITDKHGNSKKGAMLPIAQYLDSPLNQISKAYSNVQSKYTILVGSKLKLIKLIQYHTKWPLFSSKYLNYLTFKRVYDLKTKGSLTLAQKQEIENYKADFNNSRSSFLWSHLDNFYT